MNIRLYNENDTRPIGDYDFCRVAEIMPSYTFIITQTGKRIFTTAKVKITLEDGDVVAQNQTSGICAVQITGIKKPDKVKVTKNVKSKSSQSFDQRQLLIVEPPVQRPVPKSSEYAGADSDEIHRARARRSGVAAGNRGQSGNSLQAAPAGEDENW